MRPGPVRRATVPLAALPSGEPLVREQSLLFLHNCRGGFFTSTPHASGETRYGDHVGTRARREGVARCSEFW